MPIEVKICGVNSTEAARAAVEGGASFIGLVFYRPSPRFVTPVRAAEIAEAVPAGVRRVGLFVDAEDALIGEAVGKAKLDLLQLHGAETPARVAALKARFGVHAMKAIRIAGPEDVSMAERYLEVADWLLFDAKPPATMTKALPGGNALSFDWRLIARHPWPLPWMLSGGLNAANLAEAVATSGAVVIDVSSGVEDRPGHKDPRRIAAFLEAARRL